MSFRQFIYHIQGTGNCPNSVGIVVDQLSILLIWPDVARARFDVGLCSLIDYFEIDPTTASCDLISRTPCNLQLE